MTDHEVNIPAEVAMEYLAIACSIRNEEFRLQLQRNAIFTAFHAALAAAAASLLDRNPILTLPIAIIAIVGVVLG
ncbi:MAG: hypothetical protein N2508_15385, partial [Anaerolineae bacterium]|nr:hypothetical protein [Anaerolineae bacterium]